ncbi:hypothetical protein GGS24DRAFT_513530 [Hypoxylon argillaceum]|nr:hypothetical protein GGS24DRAFT_513530 [Hypoxylon argillaceum]
MRLAPNPAPKGCGTLSGSIKSDEDWTQVSDPGERRSIQNRTAQRRYREKLKRKLERKNAESSDKSSCTTTGNEEQVLRNRSPSMSSSFNTSTSADPQKPGLRFPSIPPISGPVVDHLEHPLIPPFITQPPHERKMSPSPTASIPLSITSVDGL